MSRRGGAPRWGRRIGRLLSLAAFVGFGAFLAGELRDGFARRGADPGSTEAGEEPEEVVSRAIETTAFGSDGTVIEIRAEEALGRSDGRQRLIEAEVRIAGADEGRDVFLAGDELVLDIGSEAEALDFIGNAVLRTDRIELSGSHLRFRGSPDRLWSIDPVQFVTEGFIGIANAMQFHIGDGDVHLQGVVAGSPPDADGANDPDSGLEVVAGRARYSAEDGTTTLERDVELLSGRIELRSMDPVVVRRDRARQRTRSVEAGFGTELRVRPPAPEEEDASPDEASTNALFLRGDRVEIELGAGGVPETVRVQENATLARGHTELRSGRARLALARDGSPERLVLTSDVKGQIETGGSGPDRRLAFVEADRMEGGFEDDGRLGAARFEGNVEARVGRATATARTARWNGASTLDLEGEPRLQDPTLLELESPNIRLSAGNESRVRATGGVTVRFLPTALGWLPGLFEGASLLAGAAHLTAGTGVARFSEGVRLRFGRNRITSTGLDVDARGGKLVAANGVTSAFEFARPVGDELTTADDETANEETANEETTDGPPETDGDSDAPEPDPFAFTAWANLMGYDAGQSRLAWRGSPRLEHRTGEGALGKLVAERLDAVVAADGTASEVTGNGDARFDRGEDQVRGDRISYRPGPDQLEAWGEPAVFDFGGRRSEGGWLEVGLSETRSRVGAAESRRVETRVRVRRPDPGTSPRRR